MVSKIIFGIVLFFIFALFLYLPKQYADTNPEGTYNVVEIGTCVEVGCAIRVKHGYKEYERETFDKVLFGTKVKCDDFICVRVNEDL